MLFVKKQWFLISLAAMLGLGLIWPERFLGFANNELARKLILMTVLYLMALPLEARVVWRTISRPWAALVGSFFNYGICPFFAWIASLLLSGDFAVGMLVAATAPCTLASAAVWTRRAGGNDITALLITVITNASCFLLTPLWLSITTQTETRLDVGAMIQRLAILVVLPMVAAQLTRLIPSVARWATTAKPLCGTIAQIGILSMVLIGAVKSSLQLAARDPSAQIGLLNFSLMIILVIAVHMATLILAYAAATSLGFPHEERVAIAFGGSQKTLMVGLYVAIEYFGGLVILPMVAYHISQLVLDTLVGEVFLKQSRAANPI